MVAIAVCGYVFIVALMVGQYRRAARGHRFELRRTHGKRFIYVRSLATGRVIMQTRNMWDLLSLGI